MGKKKEEEEEKKSGWAGKLNEKGKSDTGFNSGFEQNQLGLWQHLLARHCIQP